MLRVAITQESRSEPEYQVILVRETDTVMDILTQKHINPMTKNIFVNGQLVKEESFARGLKTFGGTGEMVFVAIKYKTVDRPRRASNK